MKCTKPPLTLEGQADQLLSRGLEADRDELIARLRSVSYYRLSEARLKVPAKYFVKPIKLYLVFQ